MYEVGVISISQLEQLADQNRAIKNGCLVDTNILISVSLPIDPQNSAAEELVQKLTKLKIPLYSNVNIRAEFLVVS